MIRGSYDASLSECQEAGKIQGEAKTQDRYVIEDKWVERCSKMELIACS